jgi:hypothetical protein
MLISQGPGGGRYMNRATCGLQDAESPTSDNLTPQETTTQDSPDIGRDRVSFPCPGSSVVAESAHDNSELNSLIKSPADQLAESTQQKQPPTEGADL